MKGSDSKATGPKEMLNCSNKRTLREGTIGVKRCQAEVQGFELGQWSKWQPECPRHGTTQQNVSRNRSIETKRINVKQLVSFITLS